MTAPRLRSGACSTRVITPNRHHITDGELTYCASPTRNPAGDEAKISGQFLQIRLVLLEGPAKDAPRFRPELPAAAGAPVRGPLRAEARRNMGRRDAPRAVTAQRSSRAAQPPVVVHSRNSYVLTMAARCTRRNFRIQTILERRQRGAHDVPASYRARALSNPTPQSRRRPLWCTTMSARIRETRADQVSAAGVSSPVLMSTETLASGRQLAEPAFANAPRPFDSRENRSSNRFHHVIDECTRTRSARTPAEGRDEDDDRTVGHRAKAISIRWLRHLVSRNAYRRAGESGVSTPRAQRTR